MGERHQPGGRPCHRGRCAGDAATSMAGTPSPHVCANAGSAAGDRHRPGGAARIPGCRIARCHEPDELPAITQTTPTAEGNCPMLGTMGMARLIVLLVGCFLLISTHVRGGAPPTPTASEMTFGGTYR